MVFSTDGNGVIRYPHLKINKTFEPYLTPCIKINSKSIGTRSVKLKTLKLLEENIGGNFCDLGFHKDFLDLTSKA